MMRELIEIDWNDVSEATPAALTALVMPFTYSIANGLAFGFISYVVLKTCTGRGREVHAATRSEEHTSELQSLMRISYAVFCLKKTTTNQSPTVVTQTKKE